MRKHILIIKFIFSILLIGFSVSANAQYDKVKLKARQMGPGKLAVNDYANLFSPMQKNDLEAKLRKFYDSTSNEIIIITLLSLDGFEVDDVTYAYGKGWKLGNTEKDNGAIMLLSKDPRKLRIEVGKGLEGALPDGLAGTIQRNIMLPLLKQDKFYEAFNEGFSAIESATKNEYKNDFKGSKNSSGGGIGGLIATMVFIIIIIYFINKNRGGGSNGGMLSRRGYRRWNQPTVIDFGPWGSGGGIFGGGNSGGGGGWGDFGGGGGGDFGGGGASSDW